MDSRDVGLGLGLDQVRQLHEDYLAALTAAAVEDGTLTNSERDELDSVASLLDLVEASAARVVTA